MGVSALDAMALAWAIVVFLGLWLIYPPLAIIAAGVGGIAVVVGLFLDKRRKGATE